jgi:hypothetical protein
VNVGFLGTTVIVLWLMLQLLTAACGMKRRQHFSQADRGFYWCGHQSNHKVGAFRL